MQWDDVQLFLTIAETGSLTAAARRLGLTQPTVTRRLQALEHGVGQSLFLRNVAGAQLSQAGEQLLAPARQMAQSAGEWSRLSQQGDPRVRGVVRLACPPGVAVEFVVPFAVDLRRQYPEISLEVNAQVEFVDLARHQADLAIRVRPAPPDSDLINVATVSYRVAAVCAPHYRDQLPPQPRWADVRWIAWAHPWQHLPPNPQLHQLVADFTPALTSNDFLVQIAACQAGIGAMISGLPSHRYAQHRLVPLDLDLGPHAQANMHIVAARSALDIRRVRVVAQALVAALQG